MPELIFKQSEFYNTNSCKNAINNIEARYNYVDESKYFNNLVNFSTAKNEPFQRWVRYREGYSTELVNELLRRSNINADTHFIADPMVGSGTTILAAKKDGYDSLGVDVNPYCQLITSAKILNPSESVLKEAYQFSKSLTKHSTIRSFTKPPLSEFFSDENLASLMTIKTMIDEVSDEKVHEILNACWFFIIEDCSNRKKDGNGLVTRISPVKDVYNFYQKTLEQIIEDYKNFPFDTSTQSDVVTGSATSFSTFNKRFCDKTGKKLGAVIFSPPYANAFDYYESYKMELLFGGLYSPEDYQEHKKEQIRNYRICYGHKINCQFPYVECLCDEIEYAVPRKEAATGKRDSRTRLMPNMLRGYFTDMKNVLMQLKISLDKSGKCYIVVDQSAYVGVIIPTDIILARIAEELGFSVKEIIICRKASTSGQQLKMYPYLGKTLRESIVCLEN